MDFHRRTLRSKITDRAMLSYIGNGKEDSLDYEGAGFIRWKAHWLASARAWRNDLAKEGLNEMVYKIDQLIKFFEKN